MLNETTIEPFEEEQIERARIRHQRQNAKLEQKFNKVSDDKYVERFLKSE